MGHGAINEDFRVLPLEFLGLPLSDLEACVAGNLELRPAAPFKQQARMAVERCGEPVDEVTGMKLDPLGHAPSEHRNKNRTIR